MDICKISASDHIAVNGEPLISPNKDYYGVSYDSGDVMVYVTLIPEKDDMFVFVDEEKQEKPTVIAYVDAENNRVDIKCSPPIPENEVERITHSVLQGIMAMIEFGDIKPY